VSAPVVSPESPTSAASAAFAALPTRRGARTRPFLAVRLDPVPRPVLRSLTDVLAEARAAAARPTAPEAAPEPGPGPAVDPEAVAARVRPVAVRVLGALAEVLAGRRPLRHLAAVCEPELFARLVDELDRRADPHVRVGGVRLCAVGPAAVEASTVLHGGRRARAVAARLEHHPTPRPGWRLTALTVL